MFYRKQNQPAKSKTKKKRGGRVTEVAAFLRTPKQERNIFLCVRCCGNTCSREPEIGGALRAPFDRQRVTFVLNTPIRPRQQQNQQSVLVLVCVLSTKGLTAVSDKRCTGNVCSFRSRAGVSTASKQLKHFSQITALTQAPKCRTYAIGLPGLPRQISLCKRCALRRKRRKNAGCGPPELQPKNIPNIPNTVTRVISFCMRLTVKMSE